MALSRTCTFLQDPHRELRGKNVLIVRGSLQETARSFHMDESTVKEQLVRAREILFEERRKRPPPHLDTKMITAWNGECHLAFTLLEDTSHHSLKQGKVRH